MQLNLLQSKKIILGFFLLMILMSGLYFNINLVLSEMKGAIVAKLETQLNTEIEVERLTVNEFNQISAQGVVIKDKAAKDLLRAEELVIRHSLIDLLINYKQPLSIVESIELESPQINLSKDKSWNFSFLAPASVQSQGESTTLFPIYIKDGQVEVKTQKQSERLKEVNGMLDLREGVFLSVDAKLADLKAKIKTDLNISGGEYEGEVNFSQLNLTNLSNKSRLNLPQGLDVTGPVAGKLNVKGKTAKIENIAGSILLTSDSLEYQGLEIKKLAGQFSLNNNRLNLTDFAAYYDENRLLVNGSIKNLFKQQLDLAYTKPQLDLTYQITDFALAKVKRFLAADLQLRGRADLRGALKGRVKEPVVSAELQMEAGQLAQQRIKDLTASLAYKEESLTINSLSLTSKGGLIKGTGQINFTDAIAYQVETTFQNLSLAQLGLEPLNRLDLTGQAEGRAEISGQGLHREKLTVEGQLKVRTGELKDYEFKEVQSAFRFAENKLFLTQTSFSGPLGSGSASGVIDLGGELDLALDMTDLSLAELEPLHQLKGLQGKVDLTGQVKGRLSQPRLSAQLHGQALEYEGIDLATAQAQLKLSADKMVLQSAKLPSYASSGYGYIDWQSQKSTFTIKTRELAAAKFNRVFKKLSGEDIGLRGSLEATTKLTDLQTAAKLESEVRVSEGKLLNKQKFDNLALDLEYDFGRKRLQLIQGEAVYKESSLDFSGVMKGTELDFNFTSPQLVWDEINFTNRLAQWEGSTELSGSVYGSLAKPKLAVKVEAEELKWTGKKVGKLKGRVDYRNDNLYLTDLIVQAEDNRYQLNGSFNPGQRKINNVSVVVNEGTLAYLGKFMPAELSYGYKFNGQIDVTGPLREPEFKLDLALEDSDGEGSLDIVGTYLWAEEADLKVAATKFGIANINKFDLIPQHLSGDLNLNGRLKGPLNAPNFAAELKLSQGRIAELGYQRLSGSLEVVDGKKVIIDQELQGKAEDLMEVRGKIPLRKEGKFDLDLALTKSDLRLLSIVVPELKSAAGQGSADLKLQGTLAKPKLSGKAKITAGSFSYPPLLDRKISNLNGNFVFEEDRLILKQVQGYYGRGNFSGGGSIELAGLTPQRYNLTLTGEQIVFEHGSWQGLNDIDISISGTGLRPVIKGDIKAYNTKFQLPVEWPGLKGDGVQQIKPQLNLTLSPGTNVRVVNKQIDIIVQGGTLNLRTIEGKVRLIGELNSNQGRFTYYNTEFELEDGKAVFRQYDYMPNLDLEATTEIFDRTIAQDENNLSDPYHQITLILTGPANQLSYQLSSDSDLSQQRIIALLTGQGGLGNLLEKDYQQALSSELRRVLGENLKKEVLYEVERSFEDSLDLDQVRIKSVLRSSEGVEVELGKYIFNNFMLKYNHSFLEELKTIGFEYYFNQGLDNLMIQGDYDNDGEYEIGLEASIPFE